MLLCPRRCPRPACWRKLGSFRGSMSRITPIPCWCSFMHGGGDEDQLIRAMPALSWRNYVGLGLRGLEPVIKRDQMAGFGWGRDFELHDRTALRSRPRCSEAETV